MKTAIQAPPLIRGTPINCEGFWVWGKSTLQGIPLPICNHFEVFFTFYMVTIKRITNMIWNVCFWVFPHFFFHIFTKQTSKYTKSSLQGLLLVNKRKGEGVKPRHKGYPWNWRWFWVRRGGACIAVFMVYEKNEDIWQKMMIYRIFPRYVKKKKWYTGKIYDIGK